MKFSVVSFCLLTTNLVCPSAQGLTVHKPRSCVATDVDRKISGSSGKDTTALLSNRSEEEEINKKDETGFVNDSQNGKTFVRRSNRKVRPPERLVSIPYV